MDIEELQRRRLASWRMDGTEKVQDPSDAKVYIDRLGVVNLFNASPEVPNLYDAHMGQPNAPLVNKWDSPSGYVYTWRWELGKVEAAFYGAVAGKKPTWVAWDALPFVLGAMMERRHPEELHELGLITPEAMRIASALEKAEGPLKTDELRQAAGFPTGKAQRNTYLKALEELESRLIVAKPFLPDGEMVHVLTDLRYRSYTEAARKLTPDQALASLMRRLLPEWIYVDPKPLSRALRIPEERLVAALCEAGASEAVDGKRRLFAYREAV